MSPPPPRPGCLAPDPDPAVLAERWFALARAGEFSDLFKAMAVKKRVLEATRVVMRGDKVAFEGFVQTLLSGLADSRPRVRFESAHALDQFGDARAVAPLVRLMDDRTPRVRRMAMHALSCHACGDGTVTLDPAIVERILVAADADPSPRVRRNAAVALGLGSAPGVAERLRDLLDRSEDRRFRQMAAWAITECEGSGLTRSSSGNT